MKKHLSLLLAAVLVFSLAGCSGNSSSQPSSSGQPGSVPTGSSQPSESVSTGDIVTDYFTANGLTVQEIPEEFEVNALVFKTENPQEQHPQAAKFVPNCVVMEGEDGYNTVLLDLAVTIPCGMENGENVSLSSGVYDLYTGRRLPTKSLNGTGGYDYSTTIEVDGVSYELFYSKENNWQWTTTEDGEDAQLCLQSWEIKVPKGYDGLVYAAVDIISDDLDWIDSVEEEEIDESEYYAMDIAEDETRNLDNTVFFRFGNEKED